VSHGGRIVIDAAVSCAGRLARQHLPFPSSSVSVPSPTETTSSTPRRNFWQRRVRDPIVAQLTQGITPEKIALTVAVGSAVALFPILGTTTLLCFLVAWVLKLNQPITQLINQALWPVHVPAIFLCVKFGERVFQVHHTRFSIRLMNELLWNNPKQFLHTFGSTALYALVGWLILAPFYTAAVYYIALPIMRGVTQIKAQAAAKAAAEQASDHPVP
jgi:uncharacterized protein (DUF2062 family)